mmetsp:Transcript_5514/g.13281  ORF Transcript_5514/g.13281 Transcript_5514/m.13281 type:complete len:82 (-) Transcript_5514:4552-4797(-)
MASRSRWLVGSSSSSTSGWATSARPNATRFFRPPDRLPTSRAPSRPRRCRVSSTRCSQFQAPMCSMRSCTQARSSFSSCRS